MYPLPDVEQILLTELPCLTPTDLMTPQPREGRGGDRRRDTGVDRRAGRVTGQPGAGGPQVMPAPTDGSSTVVDRPLLRSGPHRTTTGQAGILLVVIRRTTLGPWSQEIAATTGSTLRN